MKRFTFFTVLILCVLFCPGRELTSSASDTHATSETRLPSTVGGTGNPSERQNLFVGCPGDCQEDGEVTVDDILTIVNVILGTAAVTTCPALVGQPSVADVIQSVYSAFTRCPLVLRYRLSDESRIAYYASSGEGAAAIEEPLTGELVLVWGPRELNVAVFRLTSVSFQSAHFVITLQTPGDGGRALIPHTLPPTFILIATVLIDGAVVPLFGETPIECCTGKPPVLRGLELCGAPEPQSASCEEIRAGAATGYVLTIFADPTTP